MSDANSFKEMMDAIVEIKNLEWNHSKTDHRHPRTNELTFLHRTLREPYFDKTDDRYHPSYEVIGNVLQNKAEALEKEIKDWTSLKLVQEVCAEGKVEDKFWVAFNHWYTPYLGVDGVNVIRRVVTDEDERQADDGPGNDPIDFLRRASRRSSLTMKQAIHLANVAKEVADTLPCCEK